jgi:hypothetical protein
MAVSTINCKDTTEANEALKQFLNYAPVLVSRNRIPTKYNAPVPVITNRNFSK